MDVARPPALPAGRRRESRRTRSGSRDSGPGGPGAVAPGPSRRGRGLAGPERRAGARRVRARLNASAGPGGTGCGASPQGGAGAVEDPLDQGAKPLTRPVRVLTAASPPRRSTPTQTWILSDSGTPMATGQPPVHHGGHRRAPGRLPGPSARRRKSLLPELASPSWPLPAKRAATCSPPTAPHRPLRTDLGAHRLRVAPSAIS